MDKTCLRCSNIVLRGKYCGLENYVSNFKTCKNEYVQKCQGRVNNYCSKTCQANKKRIELGYLSENAKNTAKKIKEKYGVDNISQLSCVKDKKRENALENQLKSVLAESSRISKVNRK